MIVIPQNSFAQNEWLEKETPNFKLIYKGNHSFLADYLLNCAEKSYTVLKKIFNYSPTEKIVLNTFDYYDYGFGEATSIPQNYIHIEIEPFEPGYEYVSYNERFQWVINHELVHIFYNDQENKWEAMFRAMFSKVAPEQIQPLTVLYSLLTNYNRYSPVWHQEAIAVYLETWLSGGFGRTLGSFDEMFFRSLVLENKEFKALTEINSIIPNNSFLLDMQYYLYGTRFSSFLADKYGNDRFLNWYRDNKTGFYSSYVTRFKNNFGVSLNDSWNEFEANEKEFQVANIKKLSSEPVTRLQYLGKNYFGWVSQPFYDNKSGNIFFSYHTKDKLASICRLNLESHNFEDMFSLPTPSLSQVSSTAFDSLSGSYFFTTNNNQLYRDLNIIDVNTEKVKLLLKDERVGNLTVSSATKTLWGIRHNSGEASLVFSDYPYEVFKTFRTFPIGEEVFNLSISPSGRALALVLHKSSGIQQLLLVDLENLASIKVIYDKGNPENPSWSADGKKIYFNSYANGVSNIFLYTLTDSSANAVTHTLKGLFRPIEIEDKTIFAFEFSTDGFVPVLFKMDYVSKLPAIEYYGQKVFENNPKLNDYVVNISNKNELSAVKNDIYDGLSNVKVQTFIPVVTGFQSSIVLGFFGRIADPLLYHDLSLEAGYSVYSKFSSIPKFHIKSKYEYKKEFNIGYENNASDFYDLFNTRKRGMAGEKYYVGLNHYYVYDNPLKIKQTTEIALYRGIESFSDNMIPVSQPDFVVAQTNINSHNFRRSIGSTDYEKGDGFDGSLVVFSSNWKSPQVSAQIFGEWYKLFNFLMPHNVFSYRLAAGYRIENQNHFQSKFFFGGFGNREIENEESRQYRKTFMFPGLPIYDLFCDKFVKISLENVFPPVKLGNINWANQYLSYFDFSIYSQSLFINSSGNNFWIDFGAQINMVFNHWYNLESTLSAGIAKAFSGNNSGFDWFVSLKLLRN